jgi:large subunit ribosomal protein L32
MPVPKRKRSRSRRDKRFANKALTVHMVGVCPQPNCKAPLKPHQACTACGHYKGAKIMQAKSERTVRRVQMKATRAAAEKARAGQQSEE